MAGKIFINYRRDDERATAARIRDRLAATFGERNVFMDVDNLQPGQRFDRELEVALAQCDVFIAVIGNQWANILAERQTAHERDFVVDEITAAIARGIPVIPVLVDGAPLPQAEALPEAIAALPFYQTLEVKHESFGRDVEALIAAIRAGRKAAPSGQGRPRRKAVVAALVAVVIAAGIGGYLFYERLEAERQRVQAIADEQAKRIARLARVAEEAKLRDETERRRKEAERRRIEEEKRHKAMQRQQAGDEAWRAATRKPATIEKLDGYLAKYPKGRHAENARERIAQIRRNEGRIRVLVGMTGSEQARWLKPGAGKSEWFKDCSNCPEMVVAPAGSFMMGSLSNEAGRSDWEGPLHKVSIPRPIAVGKFEVTFGQFDWFVRATGRSAGECWTYKFGWKALRGQTYRNPGFPVDDRQPVVCVNWNDATAFVAWLSEYTGKPYRLLTEAEWEYVARAGSTSAYWWGQEIGQGLTNCDGCGSRWDAKQTAVVGSFSANAFGIHDIHGNVSEWVQDCWNGSYVGAPSSSKPWTKGDCDRRVIRGGHYGSGRIDLRSADRARNSTENRYKYFGFRVARTL